MHTPLDQVAASADAVADDQREIARQARSMRRLRQRDRSWGAIMDQQPVPAIIVLLRRSTRLLATVTVTFTAALARELAGEGETHRQIARRLGVSHQRVTTLLRGSRSHPD